MKLTDLTEQERIRLGVAAAGGIKYNLPVDGFGQMRRLNDYADIWGAAARNFMLTEFQVILDERAAAREEAPARTASDTTQPAKVSGR